MCWRNWCQWSSAHLAAGELVAGRPGEAPGTRRRRAPRARWPRCGSRAAGRPATGGTDPGSSLRRVRSPVAPKSTMTCGETGAWMPPPWRTAACGSSPNSRSSCLRPTCCSHPLRWPSAPTVLTLCFRDVAAACASRELPLRGNARCKGLRADTAGPPYARVIGPDPSHHERVGGRVAAFGSPMNTSGTQNLGDQISIERSNSALPGSVSRPVTTEVVTGRTPISRMCTGRRWWPAWSRPPSSPRS